MLGITVRLFAANEFPKEEPELFLKQLRYGQYIIV